MLLEAEGLKKEDVLKAYKYTRKNLSVSVLYEIINTICKYSSCDGDTKGANGRDTYIDIMTLSTTYMCGYMRGKREERAKKEKSPSYGQYEEV